MTARISLIPGKLIRGQTPNSCTSEFGVCPRITALGPASFQIIAIHSCDHFELDLLWAHGFAFTNVRAASEEFLFYLFNHPQDPAVTLRLPLRQKGKMTDLRRGKEGGRSVRTSSDAG